MALGDIKKGQYYLEQAKQKIMESIKNENLDNTSSQHKAIPEDDLNKDEAEQDYSYRSIFKIMQQDLEIPVTYKGQELSFKGYSVRFGYVNHIMVDLYGTSLTIELDEEGN